MQYHYVVFYDDVMDEWRVDLDSTATSFHRGNIFDPDSDKNSFWHWAEEGSEEEAIDFTLGRLLESVMGSIPTPAPLEA